MDKVAFFYELGYRAMLEKLAQLELFSGEDWAKSMEDLGRTFKDVDYGELIPGFYGKKPSTSGEAAKKSVEKAIAQASGGTKGAVKDAVKQGIINKILAAYGKLPMYGKVGIPAAALGLGAAGTYALTKKKKSALARALGL